MSLTKDECVEVILLSGLNPLDYFFWGMLKAQVYSVKNQWHESSEATHHGCMCRD